MNAPVAPLVGSLADFPVHRVLELISAGGRSGSFRVAGAMPLHLVVLDGSVGPGGGEATGRDDVVQALFHLALLGDGDFSFEPGPVEGSVPPWSFDDLLRDVTDRVDRWRDIGEVLPSLDVIVRVRSVDPHGEALELSRVSWNVAVSLDGSRSVRDVAMLLGGDAFATMEAVHGLITLGLAEVVPTDPVD